MLVFCTAAASPTCPSAGRWADVVWCVQTVNVTGVMLRTSQKVGFTEVKILVALNRKFRGQAMESWFYMAGKKRCAEALPRRYSGVREGGKLSSPSVVTGGGGGSSSSSFCASFEETRGSTVIRCMFLKCRRSNRTAAWLNCA
jgi:hypothetical protein